MKFSRRASLMFVVMICMAIVFYAVIEIAKDAQREQKQRSLLLMEECFETGGVAFQRGVVGGMDHSVCVYPNHGGEK